MELRDGQCWGRAPSTSEIPANKDQNRMSGERGESKREEGSADGGRPDNPHPTTSDRGYGGPQWCGGEQRVEKRAGRGTKRKKTREGGGEAVNEAGAAPWEGQRQRGERGRHRETQGFKDRHR